MVGFFVSSLLDVFCGRLAVDSDENKFALKIFSRRSFPGDFCDVDADDDGFISFPVVRLFGDIVFVVCLKT